MAIVRLGGIVTSISGSVGSTVFSERAGGTTLGLRSARAPRASSIVVHRSVVNDDWTLDARATMSFLRLIWSNYFTADQLEAWKTYALNTARKSSSGQSRRLDGQASWISYAFRPYYCGLGALGIPPSAASYPAPQIVEFGIYPTAPWTAIVSPGFSEGTLFLRFGLIPKPKQPFEPRITHLVPFYRRLDGVWESIWHPRQVIGSFSDLAYFWLEYRSWFLTRPISPPSVYRLQCEPDPV